MSVRLGVTGPHVQLNEIRFYSFNIPSSSVWFNDKCVVRCEVSKLIPLGLTTLHTAATVDDDEKEDKR